MIHAVKYFRIPHHVFEGNESVIKEGLRHREKKALHKRNSHKMIMI